MKLLFLWVNNYKCFGCKSGYSYNFCENYRFRFEYEDKKLYCSQAHLDFNIFLSENNSVVDNISVIVGSNGSGKTSVFSLIFDILFSRLKFVKSQNTNNNTNDNNNINNTEQSSDSESVYLAILEIDGKLFYKANFSAIALGEVANLNLNNFDTSQFSNPICLCYYSNMFSFVSPFLNYLDGGSSFDKKVKFWNLSTSHLLNIKEYKDHGLINKKHLSTYNRSISKIGAEDFCRCVDFFSYYYAIKKSIDFDIGICVPRKIRFYVDDNEIYLVTAIEDIKKNDRQENKKSLYICATTFFNLGSLLKKSGFKNNWLYNFLLALFEDFVVSNYGLLLSSSHFGAFDNGFKFFNKNFDKNSHIPIKKNFIIDDLILLFKEMLIKIKKGFKNIDDTEKIAIGVDTALNLINFADYLYRIQDNEKYFNEEKGKCYLEFNVSFENKDEIKNFYKLCAEFDGVNKFLKRSFDPYLSDGEYNIITTYSRIYDKLLKEGRGCKNLILMMDEVEITFHPSLQQKFIKSLIDFFNIFTQQHTDLKVQVIIATHSPIILSDIPSGNVVFLKKNEKGGIECANTDGEVKTFASNIIDLYSNSFFVDNSVGEFASNKIKSLLSKTDLTEYDNKLIDCIGDRILKMLIRDKINFNKNSPKITATKEL